MPVIVSIVAILIAYLFGSIPMGYIVARLYGIDVTASGSGRIGGTNVLRAAGAPAAGLTVLGDVLKGLIPLYLMVQVGLSPLTIALAMPAAVLGHNYSIFLGFKGGVGAGTAVGAVSGVSFPAGLTAAICGLIALTISRYASVLSTTVAITSVIIFTILTVFEYTPFEYIIGAALNMAIIVYSLRPNYARLKAGTERRIGQKTENITKISSQDSSG